MRPQLTLRGESSPGDLPQSFPCSLCGAVRIIQPRHIDLEPVEIERQEEIRIEPMDLPMAGPPLWVYGLLLVGICAVAAIVPGCLS
jgi:hypothetical protein